MSRRYTILVAEDDPHIRDGIEAALQSEGYDTLAARDGDEALRLAQAQRPDLLLLDIMMPGRNGYDVCRALRSADRGLPIIMLTAKGEEIDKVLGLELGADDYLTKPFGVRELLARIAAVLRRAQRAPAPGGELPDLFVFGAAEIDRLRYAGRRGRERFTLTAREMQLIAAFYRRPDEVMPRDELLSSVWGVAYLGTTRTLDQHVAQLRKKIESEPANPRHLLTVHGVGYRYRPPAAG